MSSPIAVPGPTRASRAPSAAVVIVSSRPWCSRSLRRPTLPASAYGCGGGGRGTATLAARRSVEAALDQVARLAAAHPGEDLLVGEPVEAPARGALPRGAEAVVVGADRRAGRHR